MATVKELGDLAPQWLRDASVTDENVEIKDGRVIWNNGCWNGGTWNGGYQYTNAHP